MYENVSIPDDMKKLLTDKITTDRLATMYNENVGMDETKKPTDVVSASFRKLNVD